MSATTFLFASFGRLFLNIHHVYTSSFSLRFQNDSSHEFCGFADLRLSLKISNGSKEVRGETTVRFKDNIVKCLEMIIDTINIFRHNLD